MYAPVVDFTAVLTALNLALQFGWSTVHVDVKAAFLNGDMNCDAYVGHPYNLPPDMCSGNYYRLRKAQYGLKQAPLRWLEKLRNCLVNDFHYKQLNSDGAVFIRKPGGDKDDYWILVLVYLDDILFVSNNHAGVKPAVDELLSVFEGTNDGTIKWYLGIKVDTTTKTRSLTQQSYVHQMLDEYGLQDIKAFDTPMAASFYEEAFAQDEDDDFEGHKCYQEMIGSLMHIATNTRSDISTAVGILAQYVSKPNKFLMKSIQRVFGYLKGTASYGLMQTELDELKTEFYCDSDYAGERSMRKSRTGSVVLVNGCAVSWSSHKQGRIAISTTEAEYVAMSECSQEVKWFRLLLAEIGMDMSGPTPLFSDKVAAQSWQAARRR